MQTADRQQLASPLRCMEDARSTERLADYAVCEASTDLERDLRSFAEELWLHGQAPRQTCGCHDAPSVDAETQRDTTRVPILDADKGRHTVFRGTSKSQVTTLRGPQPIFASQPSLADVEAPNQP